MKEDAKNQVAIIEYVRRRENKPMRDATDEDVEDFINLFMESSSTLYKGWTSYGLKHIAERVIGHLFYGSTTYAYAYVSNAQMKEIMHKHFSGRPDFDGSPNELFKFKWKKGIKEILNYYNQM